MRQWTLSLAVLALVAAPVFAGKYNKTVSIGDKAPAIIGIPAVDGGKEVTLNMADVKEDVVVVVFLANHCPVVKGIEDRQVDLVKSYKGKSVKFIGVCCSGAPGYEETDGISAIKRPSRTASTTSPTATTRAARSARPTAPPSPRSSSSSTRTGPSATPAPSTTSQRDESKVTKTYVKTAIDALLANESIEMTETKRHGCGVAYKQ